MMHGYHLHSRVVTEADELEYDFKTTRKVMFSPQTWKDHARVALETIKIEDDDGDQEVDDDENVNKPDEGKLVKIYQLFIFIKN